MDKLRGFEVCIGYENTEIHLPIRQTKHSVGYDIEACETTTIPSMFDAIQKGEDIKPSLVHTGIKAYFQPDEGLYLYNRSSRTYEKGIGPCQ